MLSKAWLAWALVFCPAVCAAQDALQAQYKEAVAAGRSEGLAALVRRLDTLARSSPGAAFTAEIHETIQAVGLLHPGSVPDRSSRLQILRAQASGNAALVRSLARIAILDQYYEAAIRGKAGNAAAMADALFEGSLLGIQASADAALRAGNLGLAESLAARVVETDPFSPLIACSYVVLGLCRAYRGDATAAAMEFQRAIAVSPLPTVYGRTQDYLFQAYRFARPAPGLIGSLFDDETATPLSGTQGLKDPKSFAFQDNAFTLIDRDQILAVSADGKVQETRAGRRIDDLAWGGSGKFFYLSEDGIDFGSGALTKLTWVSAGKTKTLGKLRSLAVDADGTVFVLDQEAGLLRGTPGTGPAIAMTPVAQARGRLLRMDRRGILYVLASDQRSVMIFSHDGKPLLTVSPAVAAGKEPSIEYFALDSLNHLYILDQASIEILSVNNGDRGIEKVSLATVPLDQRPAHKNLRVIAVAADGSVSVTGKNEDNWVVFR